MSDRTRSVAGIPRTFRVFSHPLHGGEPNVFFGLETAGA
jgi:hypothetical protein